MIVMLDNFRIHKPKEVIGVAKKIKLITFTIPSYFPN